MSFAVSPSSEAQAELHLKSSRWRIPYVARFAWATLLSNVAVVLWGGYVRATGSGAGCGDKWPQCGGEVLGATAKTQTLIEFTHRATSGVALIMVGVLVVWTWRETTRRDWARYSAILSAVFLANEALLGAALVLLGHVAQDRSSSRILFLCLHFGNTLLLLAMLALTAWWLRFDSSLRLIREPREAVAIGTGLLATMVIGITGAVAALGDTLFPAVSLRSSLARDFGSGTPALLRLRLVHPIVAVTAAVYVLWVIFTLARREGRTSRTAIGLLVLFLAQIGIGIVNVLLLAPIWLQILHLCVADLLWITLVIASADLLFKPATAPKTATVRA
jgi:heme A synthase